MIDALVAWDREVTRRELERNCRSGSGSGAIGFDDFVRQQAGLDPWSLLGDEALRQPGPADSERLLYRTIVSGDARMLAYRIDDRLRQLRALTNGRPSMDKLISRLYEPDGADRTAEIYTELARRCDLHYAELCSAVRLWRAMPASAWAVARTRCSRGVHPPWTRRGRPCRG